MIHLYGAVIHSATRSLYPLLFCRQSMLQILLIFCGVAVMALLSAIVGWAWRKFWDAPYQTLTLRNPGKSYSTPTTLISYFSFMETSFWFTFTPFWYDQFCQVTSKGERSSTLWMTETRICWQDSICMDTLNCAEWNIKGNLRVFEWISVTKWTDGLIKHSFFAHIFTNIHLMYLLRHLVLLERPALLKVFQK